MTTKRTLLGALITLAVAGPAIAQPAPPRLVDVARALHAANPHLVSRDDDLRRALTKKIAEQMAFEFGLEWGQKTQHSNLQFPSKDCVAKVQRLDGHQIVRGVCWDWQDGTTLQPVEHPHSNDIAGQFFLPVDPVNHLGGAPGPVPPQPPPPADLLGIEAALERLEHTLSDLAGAVDRVEAKVDGVRTSLEDHREATRQTRDRVMRALTDWRTYATILGAVLGGRMFGGGDDTSDAK